MSNLEPSRPEGMGRGLAHAHTRPATEPEGEAGLPTQVHAVMLGGTLGASVGPTGPPVSLLSGPVLAGLHLGGHCLRGGAVCE